MALGRPPRIVWLLPVAFVIHDAEEFVTWKAWLAEHGTTVSQWLQRLFGTDPAAPLQPMSDTSVLRAMSLIFALLFVATAAFSIWPRPATRLVFLVVLGGFFLHGFVHLAQAIVVGGYTPGVVTALLVVIPCSMLIYRRMSARKRIPARLAIFTAAVGGLLILPAILLALSLGRA